jgi:hypothetical protein
VLRRVLSDGFMPVRTEDAVFDFTRNGGGVPSSVTITRTSEQDFKSRQPIVLD